jgi:hypothetical protein
MPVQKRGCFFAVGILLFCLMVTPGPAFAVTIQQTPDRVTQEGTITPPSAEVVLGFGGTSYLHPAHDEENEIILVDP